MSKRWYSILMLAVSLTPAYAYADDSFCPVLAQVSNASHQDFAPIKGREDGSMYAVSVKLPFADTCGLDRTLEEGFGELRYQCDFKSLNFAHAGSSDMSENVYRVAGLYADMIGRCRPELVRKTSENPYAKVISFVDDKGHKWFDISSMDTYFFVEAFNAERNPNY